MSRDIRVSVAAAIALGSLACSGGSDTSGTCADAARVEVQCLSTVGDPSKYTDGYWARCITKACDENHFNQDCIVCILETTCRDEPKDSDLPETPWEQCTTQGRCPKNYKQELVYGACPNYPN